MYHYNVSCVGCEYFEQGRMRANCPFYHPVHGLKKDLPTTRSGEAHCPTYKPGDIVDCQNPECPGHAQKGWMCDYSSKTPRDNEVHKDGRRRENPMAHIPLARDTDSIHTS